MDRPSPRSVLLFAGLLVLTLAVYWPAHRFGFVDFDDDLDVYDNPKVHTGINAEALQRAFCTIQRGNYIPLVWLSFNADWLIFHLQPGPMHVEEVVLHLISGILLWRWLYLATGELTRSFAVAALFLCHPMHVESVAWIAERKDALSTAFLMGAILAYVRFCRSSTMATRRIAYAMMLILFALSLLSKAMGVTLPAFLLLLDFWPLGRRQNKTWLSLWAEKMPLFAMSVIATVIGGFAQVSGNSATSLAGLGLLDRIDNALVCYVIYIAKLAVPTDLSVLYVHPGSRSIPAVVAAAGLLMVITIVCFGLRSRRPYLIVGWLWFLGTLAPVIGIMQIGSQAMADRYSYFPSIGLFVASVWFVGDLVRGLNRPEQYRFTCQALTLVAVLTAFTAVAHNQVLYWRNSESLFTHAVQVSDDTPVSHVILGQVAIDNRDYQRAMSEYQRSEEIARNPKGYDGLGNAWVNINPVAAVQYYKMALKMVPRSPAYLTHLATALRLNGNVTEAHSQAISALSIDPSYAPARLELAAISAKQRR